MLSTSAYEENSLTVAAPLEVSGFREWISATNLSNDRLLQETWRRKSFVSRIPFLAPWHLGPVRLQGLARVQQQLASLRFRFCDVPERRAQLPVPENITGVCLLSL